MPEGTGAPEEWRAVVGFEGFYEVSDAGKVRSVDRVVVDRNGRRMRYRSVALQDYLDGDGRPCVALTRNGEGRTVYVHHLVLEAFVCPRPPGMKGCHNNGNPADNHPSNLRWDTQHENMLDKGRHGTDHCRNRKQCPLGHLLVAPNLVACHARIGHRACLACSRARSVCQYARRKGRPLDLCAVAAQKYALIMGSAA